MKNNKQNSKIKVAIILFGLVFTIIVLVLIVTDDKNNNSSNINREEITTKTRIKSTSKNILFCGVDESEQLTDVLMFAKIDYKSGNVDILQIPRDSFVGDIVETGKINEIYRQSGDISDLSLYLSQNFKLFADNYVIVNLDLVKNLVNEVGGVTITLDEDLRLDNNTVLLKGENYLDKNLAEIFVRHRKSYINADIGRMNAQQIFLKGVYDKVSSLSKRDVANIIYKNYKYVNTNLSFSDIIDLYSVFENINFQNIRFHIPDGSGTYYGSYAVFELYAESLAKIVNNYFNNTHKSITTKDLNIKTVNPIK